MRRGSPTLAQLDQLAQLPMRFGRLADEAALARAIVAAAARLLRAGRVLLVVRVDAGELRIAGSKLPAGESAAGLLEAVSPWLAEGIATGESRLRHGPEGAEPIDQRSCLVAPLVAPQGALGCLYADVEGAHGRFEEAERALLAALAAQAAVALANLRAASEAARQAAVQAAALESHRAERALIDSIQQGIAAALDFNALVDLVGDKLREVLQTETIGIRWYDANAHRIHFLYEVERGTRIHPAPRTPVPGGPVEALIRSRRPALYATRAELRAAGLLRVGQAEARSALRVPILRGESMIGFISLENHEREDAYTEADLRLVGTIAASMGLALDNARLFNETREALDRQTATADVLAVISGSPTDVRPVFEAIAERARVLCKADVGMTSRFDGALVHLVGIHGVPPQAEASLRARFPLALAAAPPNLQRAIVERAPVQIADVQREPGYRFAENARESGLRSILSVPLLHEGRAIGTIGVSRSEPGVFPPGAVTLLETFARQAVIAIENVRLFNETQGALERQKATAEVLQVISRSMEDATPVFQAISDSAMRLFKAHSTLVTRVVGDEFRLLAFSSNFPERDAQLLRAAYPLKIATSFAGQALAAGRAIFSEDVLEETRIPERVRKISRIRGFRSQLSAPMIQGGTAIGMINVARAEPGPFSAEEVALLQTFADQAVIATQNAQLFNETKEALDRQTATAAILKVISESPTDIQPVFRAIVDAVFRLFDVAMAVLFSREGSGYRVMSLAKEGQPAGEPSAALHPLDPDANFPSRVMVEKSMLHLPDWSAIELPPHEQRIYEESAIRASLTLPIIRDGDCIGCIGVVRRIAGAFSDKEIGLMQSFVDQAAIAIENVRLFNETKEALEHQTATAEVLQVISSSVSDTVPVFEKIMCSGRQLFDNSTVTLGLLGDDGMIHIHQESDAFNHPDEWARKATRWVQDMHPRPARESIYGYAMHKRQVLYFPDVQHGAGVPPGLRESATSVGNYSALYAPLMWEERGIGALSVSRFPPAPFSDKEIALLRTFADQAVIAIQNARMFRETSEALERQTATAEILRVISESPTDTAPVFDAIVAAALRLVDGTTCHVTRVEGDMLH
ncbi:MAG: GAF domain-containing protein, partial [Burkholderiales bacterium]|nr:GAF domain-containing protein [Burkholderiales bacterium]